MISASTPVGAPSFHEIQGAASETPTSRALSFACSSEPLMSALGLAACGEAEGHQRGQ